MYVSMAVPQLNSSKSCLTLAHQCKKYIDDHLAEDLTTQSLSQIFFLNPNYLSGLFTKEVGISIHQYIIHQRITHANQLIKQGMPLSEIASRIGYKSYQGFFKAYQQIMGMSPIDFRAQHYNDQGEYHASQHCF